MGNLKYEITYKISFYGGPIWPNKTMLVYNCDDKYNAESKLSKYLIKKYENVLNIEIIKCIQKISKQEKLKDIMDNAKGNKDILSSFGAIFGDTFK